jgi:hypothetical protein
MTVDFAAYSPIYAYRRPDRKDHREQASTAHMGRRTEKLFRSVAGPDGVKAWVRAIALLVEQMPELRVNTHRLSPFWCHVEELSFEIECRQVKGAHGRDWQVQLGPETGGYVDDGLKELLKRSAGDEGSVEVMFSVVTDDRWEPLSEKFVWNERPLLSWSWMGSLCYRTTDSRRTGSMIHFVNVNVIRFFEQLRPCRNDSFGSFCFL